MCTHIYILTNKHNLGMFVGIQMPLKTRTNTHNLGMFVGKTDAAKPSPKHAHK